MRLTSAGLTNASSGTQLYQTQPTYDAVSNVVGVQTSVGSQTDTQQFCYNNLNQLTWSGTNGTPPCTGTSITAGTLTAAQYQQSDSYNIDGGLTTGPQGSYTYGDNTHPHAVTSTSSGYSASYDAAGNMTCRATSNASVCSGSSPTGQQLSYDAEGRLSSWQDQPTLPGKIVNYLYDGEGHRVAMQSTVSGTTTLTSYIGSIEEIQTTGSTTQTTTYYTVGGKRIAADVNGTFYYFGYDALGSQVAVLNATGSLVGAQLYGPYGASRYNTGTIPTSIGFTGQQADSVTGLDYYVARYYDALVGVFLSADSVQGNMQGIEPYVYVKGNPETGTDPTGHCWPLCTIIIGAIVGGVAAAVTDLVTGRPVTWQDVVGGIIAGGLLATLGVGIVAALGGPASAAVAGAGFWSATASTLTAGNATWVTAIAASAIVGAATGLAGGITAAIYHFWPGPYDPTSYKAGLAQGILDGRATQVALDHPRAKPTPTRRSTSALKKTPTPEKTPRWKVGAAEKSVWGKPTYSTPSYYSYSYNVYTYSVDSVNYTYSTYSNPATNDYQEKRGNVTLS